MQSAVLSLYPKNTNTAHTSTAATLNPDATATRTPPPRPPKLLSFRVAQPLGLSFYEHAAYSGRLGAQTSDSRRRGEFWHWWLYEAVPEAWYFSGQLPPHDAVLRPKIW